MGSRVAIIENSNLKYNSINDIKNNKYESSIEKALKELLISYGLDIENKNKRNWNPLKVYIKPGNTVLIKPNMVLDHNLGGFGEECLYTNPCIVFYIIKYVAIALNKSGKIIIADAPVQQCNFEKLVEESGYKEIIEYYKSTGIEIELKDLRGLKSYFKNGNLIQKEVINNGIVVDLGDKSLHHDNKNTNKLRITNYDPNELLKHHNEKKHEYYIAKEVLEADVIINMPKPKAHRKAGVTIGLKNFVGANVRKEFLPHHKIGDKKHGGDEYEKSSIFLAMSSKLKDKGNICRKAKKYMLCKICNGTAKLLSGLDKRFISKEQNREGSWYGNDTIWRTILDINKIVFYADKKGKITNKVQRKIINMADMIVVGEKEGPLLPSPKYCGVLVFSEDIYAFDYAIATIMGFDINKIPTLSNINYKEKIEIISNNSKWNNKKIKQIKRADTLKIEASSGWKNHIELR